MSSNTFSEEQGRPDGGGPASSKAIGKLRSTCDSCRRAKIRCSGGDPCSACLRSFGRCVYSPGVRLGRPKGSKNKRTLMQETSNNPAPGLQSRVAEDANISPWADFLQRQLTDSMWQDTEHGFSADDLMTDDYHDLLLDPALLNTNPSFVDSMNTQNGQSSPGNSMQPGRQRIWELADDATSVLSSLCTCKPSHGTNADLHSPRHDSSPVSQPDSSSHLHCCIYASVSVWTSQVVPAVPRPTSAALSQGKSLSEPKGIMRLVVGHRGR
ncbi:hypothetical protein HIM_11968 [Hirsutella minnesotensis 3608]|uniref:Zn(2)-C6 fungal-type domain-containing protein n=1 Tax=Hirsutella minnesotensis 3608 TaxID=1043627 RepID=A0A0F7ZQX8_9HYPO|nr:hypothetical protein HIM_11968 [Hirsutella minnesotensis 3608]